MIRLPIENVLFNYIVCSVPYFFSEDLSGSTGVSGVNVLQWQMVFMAYRTGCSDPSRILPGELRTGSGNVIQTLHEH